MPYVGGATISVLPWFQKDGNHCFSLFTLCSKRKEATLSDFVSDWLISPTTSHSSAVKTSPSPGFISVNLITCLLGFPIQGSVVRVEQPMLFSLITLFNVTLACPTPVRDLRSLLKVEYCSCIHARETDNIVAFVGYDV